MWPDWWQPYVDVFLQGLSYLQSVTGATVTSYTRTNAHNAEVGGVAHSQHLLGIAADLVPVTDQLVATAQAIGFGYVLDEGTHVHVQLFRAGELPDWLWQWLAPSNLTGA